MACTFITIDQTNGYTITINESFFDLSSHYSISDCNTENCNFIDFCSEYLFCCACSDYIVCTRFKYNFEKINLHFYFEI